MSQMIAILYALLAVTVSPTRSVMSPPARYTPLISAYAHVETNHEPATTKQHRWEPERSITLMLLQEFTQPGLAAFIRRTPGDSGEDVIAVKAADLTPALLAHALATLSRSRAHDGQRPTDPISIYISEGARFQPPSGARNRLASSLVVRLRTASRRAIADIGDVPTITIAASELNGLGE